MRLSIASVTMAYRKRVVPGEDEIDSLTQSLRTGVVSPSVPAPPTTPIATFTTKQRLCWPEITCRWRYHLGRATNSTFNHYNHVFHALQEATQAWNYSILLIMI